MCLGGDNDFKSPSLLAGYIYRNPASPAAWFDNFVRVIDKANAHQSNILLVRVFDTDSCKPHPTWNTTASLFGFHQLVQSAQQQKKEKNKRKEYLQQPQLIADILIIKL